MGKIDLFSITLNKNCEYFYSGELLSGKVNVTLKKPLKVKYIKLYIKGVVELYWEGNEKLSIEDETDEQEQETKKTFYYHKQVLYNSIKNSKQTIDKGDIVFPFETTLPLNLPSSYYDKKIAKIYYVITSVMKKRLFFETAQSEFKIRRNYDFNLYPTLKCPIENSKIFDLNLNQSISVNFVLLQGGYTQGDDIPYKLKINNQGQIPILEIHVLLVKRYTFNKKNNTRKRLEKVVNQVVIQLENDKADYDFPKNSLFVPKEAECSTGKAAKIFTISYFVSVYLRLYDVAKKIHFFLIPVEVGNCIADQ